MHEDLRQSRAAEEQALRPPAASVIESPRFAHSLRRPALGCACGVTCNLTGIAFAPAHLKWDALDRLQNKG